MHYLNMQSLKTYTRLPYIQKSKAKEKIPTVIHLLSHVCDTFFNVTFCSMFQRDDL